MVPILAFCIKSYPPFTDYVFQSIFFIIVYIGVLAAPMFFVATLFSSAAAGIEEAVNALTIPNLNDVVNLGPFDFIGDALSSIVDFLTGFLEGLLYFILIILFDQFISGIKAQFIGSFTSIVFLVIVAAT